jgi:hypothetical protein
VDGKPIPGVTKIIADVGLSDYSSINPGVLEYASQRGTYIHDATALYDQHDLDESKLDAALKPYLQAWKHFLADSGFVPELIEEQGFNDIYWYAGIVDRIGHLGRKKAVVDIKSGVAMRWHGYQTCAYSMIFFPGMIPLRLSVYLKPDGTYSIKEHAIQQFPGDKEIFLSALNVYNAKRMTL